MKYKEFSPLRWVVTVYGLLVGFAGIEHGIFEVLQGDIPTEDIMIDAIGDSWRFWPGASERALTLIPNYLYSGIISIMLGVIVVMWSWMFIERKYGATIFFILTLNLFLVGGGFAPIFVSLLAGITATRINQPLNWWKNHMPRQMAKSWPWILILFVLIFMASVGMQIFGSPLGVELTTSLVLSLALGMLVLLPIVVISGIAEEITE